MDGVIVYHNSVQSAEDCVVLLEELIQSNRKLCSENHKLRKEHKKATKNQGEVLPGVLGGADMQNTRSSGSTMLAGKYCI